MPGPLKGVLRLSSQQLTEDQQDPVWEWHSVRTGCVPEAVGHPSCMCVIEFLTILEADTTIHILLMRKLSG